MDENQDKIVINELKPFDKQVDDVLSGTDMTSSHLEVLKITPPILRMVGVPNLPILMTARHVRTITQEDGADSANYHGLGVELVKHLPELISDPVMIMDSISPDAKAQNSIVIVTQMVDNKNRPVIGAIKLNGFGRQNSKIISANILTSAYGKDNFQSFIERNIKQGSVLYVDKEKSQALSVNPGIQFPDVMASLSFNTIIRKTNAFVNSDEQKSSEKSKRSPLLINLFAGPSAGKTTAALELTAALKKKGFNVEYVSEYAKELVLENKTELLKNQVHVTDVQFHRLDRLRNSDVEIIVTDSPVLLGKVYGEGKISKEYGEKLLTYHNSFNNFNLFVNRGSTFQTEGRVHNLEQSKELDAKILAMLQDNRIFYGNYNHDEINKTVERITTTFSRLNKLEETTEKNEGSMTADTNNANAQSARERVQQIRDGMVKTLLEHIEKNPTDWQSGWNNIAAGAPYNGKTSTAYRGLNALYLAFLGAERGYKDTRWVTFNQAKELGASVKKGEKSAPVIFFEFYDRKTKKAFDNRTVKDMTDEEKTTYLKENVYAVMKYSSVFNAEQCHNFPERKEIAMSEEEMANQNAKIETIIANSGAPVRYDGGSRAYYSPGTDSIHLPAIAAFDTMQDYYATALHEIAHSTGHESRLNRDLSGGFGSESYAKEELRAELACVFMQMEQGIQLNGKHITNHAAYLNSWLQAAKNDTSVFFKAAADAQRIADYVVDNYLQAAAGAVIEDENVPQEESEEKPERNPMAEYLRAAQLDSAVSDAEERSWEQENIRDWYTSAYPNDEAGLDIHPNATFKDLRDEVNRPNPISVYGMLGEDSVVRERAFTRLAELSGSSYASIYSAFLGETAAQKLENARALAKRLATETGEPYVTIEWSEHQALHSYDVMSLSEADKKLAALDAQEDKNEGYYKTKLHIDYVFESEHDAYECCRFNIGTEGGGLVHHIDEFLKYDTFLDAEERQQAENALKYFKVHMDLSAMVDTAIASNLPLQEQFDVQSYVLAARGAVNSAVPFSTYKLPEMSAFEQEDNTEHQFLDKTRYGSPINGIAEHPVGSGKFVAIIDNSEQKEDAFPDQYPPSLIIAHDYNPQNGEWQTGAFGFSDYDEARDYLIEHYGFDIGQGLEAERSEQEKLINDAASWYSMERPQLKLQDCLDAVREMDAETIREYAEQYRAYLDSAAEFMNDTVDRSAYQVKTSYMYQAYTELQNNNPDAFIVCRIGGDGLYQVLGEKAKIVAEQCNLPLESRDVGEPNQVPMVSIPIADAYPYIDKLREIGNVVIEVEGRRLNLEQRTATEMMREQPSDSSNSEQEVKEYAQTLREYDLITGKPERSEEDYITQAQNEIAEFNGERQATDSNQRFYYPINEEAARRAQEANSYSDYKEGSATAEYRRNVDRAIDIATKQKALVDPMYHERIDALLDTYAKRLAANINEGNVIDARMPSYLITGGGNFNVGKKQKQNAARDRNHQEWQEIQSILDRIRSTGKGGISSDDPNSIQKLTAKLEGLEKSQETMKAVNAYYRKNKTIDGCPELTAEQIAELKADMKRFPHLEGKPYPTWALSNNNAEIRRVKERIEELSKRQEGGFVGWEFNGGEVRANTADNRLQIFFEEKPDEETRSDLKHNGFKWSPKANAWQRQLTENAYYAADRINAIQPLSGEKPTALQRAYVRQHNAEVAGNVVQSDDGEQRVGDHEEKITLEQARNAMLDAQELLQNHYAVRIENVPHTDPEDGYESEEPAQVIYTISKHGTVREWKTIPLDSDVFSSDLPNGRIISYEPVEFEELEEIAKKVREPIQTFKEVLRAEIETGTVSRRSDGYYDQRVDDILDEHYRTEYGLFKRDIENPKYLSGMLYVEETFRGERVVSLTQDESGKNVAIIAQANGKYVVAEDYSPEDGRRWGKSHYFENQKTAEEFRAKNLPSAAERANRYQALAASKSPLGQEYARIKGEHADSVVFYRVGDFYEVLGADAERVAEKLELTLTGRTVGTEEHVLMCGVPSHAIDQYADTLAKKGENVIIADGTDIREHKAKIDLRERRLREYADTLRRNDLEVGNAAQTDEYYLNQAREQIAAYERSDDFKQALREDFPNDFIDDSPQDMAQIQQNQQNIFCTDFGGEYRYFLANEGLAVEDICNGYALNPIEGFAYSFGREITEKQYKEIQSIGKGFNIDFLDDINAFTISQDGKVVDRGYLYEDLVLKYQKRENEPVEAQERKRVWLSIELPNGAVGGHYGENTMIKMPKGEFSYYSFYVPTRFLKEADGKTQLRVASDYTFRLNNDGRQVELTGQELKDSFAGKHLDKTYKRVAPSRKYAQGLADLEKNVPAELKAIPNWCCYRTRWNEEKGKKDKFIISPIDGKWTSSKEPGKWVTFDAALKYARENNCEGLSVLLDKQHGITCIDLDKCILNAETGEMKQRATKLVEALSGTYIERSTSGNGLHIFVKDDILKNGTYNSQSMVRDEDPRGDLEVFDDKRIMSLTGDMYSKGNTLTRAGSAATVYLRQELGERRRIASNGTKPQPTASQSLSDNELIRWIRGSKQGAKFDDLYSGRGVSGDRSNDDGKLAHLLLYFNGGDKEQAFRIMRESGAYRPDKPDSYYRHTIDKMNDKIEVYAKRPTFSADGHGKPKGKGPGNGKKGSQA